MKHILIILFCIPILHISLYSDSVSDAWKSLENNDFMKAEEHFRNAITTDPKIKRVHEQVRVRGEAEELARVAESVQQSQDEELRTYA
jgi:Tfp pilus assembly protein PilF